jgi:hypothetical protein
VRIRHKVIGLVMVTVAALLTSCAHNCTVIGADSGVLVHLDLSAAARKQVTTVRVCVAAHCVGGDRVGEDVWFAGVPSITDGDPIEASVDVRDAAGRELAGGSTTATPVKNQPNGPECEPTAWQASVTVTADGVHAGS